MANIRKRGNTYQIRVSCGYDTQGNQVVQTMTWKPTEGMTPRQIEKDNFGLSFKFFVFACSKILRCFLLSHFEKSEKGESGTSGNATPFGEANCLAALIFD